MSKQDGLRILKAVIKNFKNIDYREIDVQGRSIVIAGKNEAGKSSLIQALVSPFNSKFTPLEPIKKGEERGELEITIGGELEGEEVKYKIGTYFTPGNKRGRLALWDANGQPIKGSEKTFLDSIIGDISFDIMEFVELAKSNTGALSKSGVKKQIEIIKSLIPREATMKLRELDIEKERIYDERTEINREVKLIKGQIEKNGFSQEDIEKYSEEKSISEINDKIRKAEKFNNAFEQSQDFMCRYDSRVTSLDITIQELEAELKKTKEERSNLEKHKVKVEEFLEKNPKPKDIEALEKEMQELSSFNTKVAQVKSMEQQQSELKDKESLAERITERLKAIDEEKEHVFSNAKMPVKGLAFNEEMVTYNGLPLSEENIPTSTIIGIGAKIGMTLNPNLRLLVIKRGESLDEERMETILKICEKQGFQLLIEKVDSSKEKLELEFVEK